MALYVLTGGPGVGKTATVKALRNRGFFVLDEVAEPLKLEQMQTSNPILPETHLYEFQMLVLERQLAQERSVHGKHAFCDRGLIDCVAYLRKGGLAVPQCITDVCVAKQYSTIFLLDPLPTYVQTEVRTEDEATARIVHGLIEQAYKDFGYEIIHVPAISIEERVEIILRSVGCFS